MSLKSKIAKISAVAALGVGATVLGSGAAFAGTNGQQVMFQDDLHVANSIQIQGFNQNGSYVAICINTPGYQTWVSGWWWQNQMVIKGFSQTNCYGGTDTNIIDASIPVSQSGSDWVTVSDKGYGG
ncbi:hypothetical protein [Streptacidiphilus sp. EB129]|jgi:hypothetical protein|uniref:hypothetical protein n=1 Tax=Streptacidiphilus sp. EB129 TaxID=3156262 RepID=UPI0035128C12